MHVNINILTHTTSGPPVAKHAWLRSRNDSKSQFPRSLQGTLGTMTPHLYIKYDEKSRGGGVSREIGWGVCGTFPEILPLFQTKICDFPYPISDLIKSLIPYFRSEALEPGASMRKH